jgi:hypothetical protein
MHRVSRLVLCLAALTLTACPNGGAGSDAGDRDGGSVGPETGNPGDGGPANGTTADAHGNDDASDGGATNPAFDPEPMPDCVVPDDPVSPTATVYSVASGAWSDPEIWNTGAVPGEGDDVQIRACDTVLYDVPESPGFPTILVNGKLTFSRDVDTTLDVGLLVVSDEVDYPFDDACSGFHRDDPEGPHTSTLEVGTPSDPVPAGVTADIRLTAFDGQDPDCAPGIINAAGRMEFHGAPLERTWAKLAATASAGSDSVTLAAPVDDWRVGDRVIVTPHREAEGNPHNSFVENGDGPHTEERVITAVDGAQLTFDTPLDDDHQGGDEGARRVEVGNLSRNVTVSSLNPDGIRGHTMYHHGSRGGISYAEFRGLGKADTLGRYPVHFHLLTDTMRGASVIGASVWDSGNRWITIHGTEFMVVRDTVTYQSRGHGVFFENGAEVYNLVENHLGVQALMADPIEGQVLEYDPNDGGCYWSANARNFAIDNVYAECDGKDSFIFDYAPDDEPMPVSMLMPDGQRSTVNAAEVSGGLVRGLEVHGHHGWGPWVRGGNFPEDQPLYFEDTKVWNTHYSIDIGGDNVVFDGVEVTDTSYGFYNNFAGPHLVRNAYMLRAGGFGTFMAYLGGHGIGLYEDVTLDDSNMGFRVTARNETGPEGQPIEIHARNFEFVNGSGGAWAGTEADNARTDPLIMAVLHDFFDTDQDAVVLPATQNLDNEGIPPGLDFVPGTDYPEVDGYSFDGYGPVMVAEGDVPWPGSPLEELSDQLAPATVILSPRPEEMLDHDGTLTVRGVVLDRFDVEKVTVNGVEATIDENNLDWSVTFEDVPPGGLTIEAVATDAAGHEEQMPHRVRFWLVE